MVNILSRHSSLENGHSSHRSSHQLGKSLPPFYDARVPLIRVNDPDDPRIDAYRNVPDPDLLIQGGLFVAEGRLVVRRLIEGRRFPVRSVW